MNYNAGQQDHQEIYIPGQVFKPLPPRHELLKIASHVLGKTQQQLASYWDGKRTDQADILMRSLDGKWHEKLNLTRTANGGFQQNGNTRIFELRSKLKAHGLFLACYEDHSGERVASFYRLTWSDEVKYHRSGRVKPFTGGNGISKSTPTDGLHEPTPATAKPVQSAMPLSALIPNFQSSLQWETGRAR